MREEFDMPAVGPAKKAYLAHLVFIFNRGSRLAERLGAPVTPLQMFMLLHIHAFCVLRKGPTKAAELIETYRAPRRTIRDGLAQMVKAGALTKTAAGYFPSGELNDFLDDLFDEELRLMLQIHAALGAYLEKIKA